MTLTLKMVSGEIVELRSVEVLVSIDGVPFKQQSDPIPAIVTGIHTVLDDIDERLCSIETSLKQLKPIG